MNNGDTQKLTFLGASPIIFLTTMFYTIPLAIINHFYKPIFEIKYIPKKILIITAIILLCIGIPLYLVTLKALKTAYKKQKLITSGIFSICRNPLFAEVIFLLLPGIILIFNSWLLLTIPCFMYVMFKVFINREESLMEKEFGEEYVKYKNKTSTIFPKFWKYKK
jgi:protein-S-isoprenylcysteine O-methyltransferase Ste14